MTATAPRVMTRGALSPCHPMVRTGHCCRFTATYCSPEGRSCGLDFAKLLYLGGDAAVEEHAYPRERRHHVLQELQSLGGKIRRDAGHSRYVAPWSGDGGDEPVGAIRDTRNFSANGFAKR